MTIIKPRTEPEELMLLRTLHSRMEMPEKDIGRLRTLEKGYEGEVRFDQLMAMLSSEMLLLSDLLLEMGGTVFQIDSLLITPSTVYLFEVKNYEGDYYMESDRWYSVGGHEIKNPLLQLERSTSLLRQLLQQHGFNFKLASYLVFVNPDFTLYQAPREAPIIFLTQLNRFVKNLNTDSQKLFKIHHRLAEKLDSLHIKENSFKKLIDYEFDQLQKGIVCPGCGGYLKYLNVVRLGCSQCSYTIKIDLGIKQAIEEFVYLFPNEKITTAIIYEWCGGAVTKHSIRAALNKHFRLVGKSKASYYVHVD